MLHLRPLMLLLALTLLPGTVLAQGEGGEPADAPVADEAVAPEIGDEAATDDAAEAVAGDAAVEDTPLADMPPAEIADEEPAEDLGVAEEFEPEPAGDGPIYSRGGLFGAGVVIAPKVGGGFGQLTSPLGASFVGELELGYTLPLPEPVNRDLQLYLSGAYAGPSVEDTVTNTDPRLPGDGTWSYDVTLQQVILGFGVLYRIPIPTDLIRPYVAAGGRMYLTRTDISGAAGGVPYGENTETATDFGGYGALGGDFFVGPGSILFEVQFGFAPVDGKVLQNTNAGSLNLAVGYRFFL